MINKLKSRPRSDSFVNEPIKKRRHWDRAIYLVLLTAFGVGLANYVAGDRLFLRAGGIVLRERSVIAATALVRVTEVAVRPGQSVDDGDVLLRAESIDVLGRLADLTMRDATLAEREVALRSRLGISDRLLPSAKERLESFKDRLSVLSAEDSEVLVPISRRETVAENVYDAETEVATLEASVESLAREIEVVEDARGHARQAIKEMKTHYANGLHTAGVQGIVSDSVPAPGEVFRPGEPIVTLMWGKPHVLAYLPETYVFGINAGDRVVVTNGSMRHQGVIEAILPVSKSIPDEFRTAFRLDESKQMARVALDPNSPFPVQSPVRITKQLALVDQGKRTISGIQTVVSKQFQRLRNGLAGSSQAASVQDRD